MAGLARVTTWIGEQQIILSILVSLALVTFIWRFDVLLERYTGASSRTVRDLRGFRVVATATMVVVTLAWIVGQPLPPWFAGPFESVGGPEVVDGIVGFLPGFAVERSGPILVTLLGFWWVWKLRAQGDEMIERFVAENYDKVASTYE